MTNAPKPEQDLTHNEHSFDGITFEVVEEEDNPEGQKVKRRGIYLWPNLIRIGLACCFVYTACAAFRLARFNVQIGVVDKRYFIGIASPLAAIIIISLVWVARDYPFIFDLRDIAIQTINAVIMVVVGLLMISNIKYYSFKQMDRKRVPFVVMLPVVLIFAAITYNIPMGILIVSIIYALSGFVTTLLAKKNNETIKT